MNGIHDMGGMHGMGPIEIEADEPVFHAPWEARVFAMNAALGALGLRNIDESRHSRERLDPVTYLADSYYERWLDGNIMLLIEKGVISREELEGKAKPAPVALDLKPAITAERVPGAVAKGSSARVGAEVAAKFRTGQRVRARDINPLGHTRIPRYVRGRHGTIDRDHGVFIFPDSNAHGLGEEPQHVYSVRFAARDLWGPDAPARDTVYVDLWDAYLEPA